MDKFRVEVIKATPNPQQVMWLAMHQDYSEDLVWDKRDRAPDETKAGEKVIKHLLSGERGHYGPLEHPQITFNVGFFPHSMMQQIRTHRVGMCLAGDTKVYFSHPTQSQGEIYYESTLEHLADLWHRGRKHQQTSGDANYMKKQIASRQILVLDTKSNRFVKSHITNIYENGLKTLYLIESEEGDQIKATKDHWFWTNQGWLQVKNFNEETKLCSSSQEGNAQPPTLINYSEEELKQEVWKTIPNYSFYEVSSLGRIRSYMPRGGKHKPKERTLEPKLKTLSKAKYNFVSLTTNPGSRVSQRFNVHRLVMEAFNPISNMEKLQVRHINGNSFDNRLSNLEWGIDQENKNDNIKNNTVYCKRGKFVGIKKIEKLSVQLPTYDLEIAHPDHNFLANNFVVHNSFDVQSFRYTGKRILDVAEGKRDAEDVFYLRPVGEYTNRQGKRYFYTEEQRQADLEWCIEATKRYQQRIGEGLAEEHARGIIPFDTRQHFVMSCNARSLMHLLDLRWKKDAQLEAQKFSELLFIHFQEWTPQLAQWYLENRAKKARLSP